MSAKINDTVRLTDALPMEALNEGALGVVVAEFFEPNEAYEVEFCDEDGTTIGQVVLEPNQFEVVT